MYCSTCGNELSKGLIFCNKCGARITTEKDSDKYALSETSTNFLIAAMLGIPIAGIGIIIGLVSVLKKELDFPNDVVVIITFMSFALLLAAEFGFLYLLLSRTRGNKKGRPDEDQKQLSDIRTRSLAEAQFQDIAAPPASVTDHTTRSFDPVYRESKDP